jgi:hypothetical protein
MPSVTAFCGHSRSFPLVALTQNFQQLGPFVEDTDMGRILVCIHQHVPIPNASQKHMINYNHTKLRRKKIVVSKLT